MRFLKNDYFCGQVAVQLILQSSGSFSVQIPANAIVVARIRRVKIMDFGFKMIQNDSK